jgi:hypothetical protein
VGASSEIAELSQHFRDSPAIFTTSPLYRALCPVVAGDRSLLALLAGRRRGQQASYLFFAAVHYLLLSGAQHPLRAFYPSLSNTAAGPSGEGAAPGRPGEGAVAGTSGEGAVAGRPGEGAVAGRPGEGAVAGRSGEGAVASPGRAGPVLLDFCRAYSGELAELIGTRLVQTSVVRRASGLLAALWAVRRQCAGPVHLIEVGASAGVHLRFDRYAYRIGGRMFGRPGSPVTVDTQWRGGQPPPDLDDLPVIASRTGVDLNPVDVTDASERLWLRALVWPEDQAEAALLTAALECVAGDPPAIIAGDAIEVCPALGDSLPPGEPRVIFHAATRMHVPAERRAAFDAAIDSVGRRGPLYHAWQEPASAQHDGARASEPGALMLHGPEGGQPVPLVLVDGHLEWMGPLCPPWRGQGG